nr:MAG TPA: hypothetical protein [Caudoviricetes sp.]
MVFSMENDVKSGRYSMKNALKTSGDCRNLH